MEPKIPSTTLASDPIDTRIVTTLGRLDRDVPAVAASGEVVDPTTAKSGELSVGLTTSVELVPEPATTDSQIISTMGRNADRRKATEAAEAPVLRGTLVKKSQMDSTESNQAPRVSLLEGISTSVEGEGSPDGFLAKLSTSTLVASAKEIGFKAAFGASHQQGLKANVLRPRALRENFYRRANHDNKPIPGTNGLSRPWETGADLADLITERPFDRHKFYMSLDLSTPEKGEQAQQFIEEVHARAVEQKLSMLTKSEDHDYDSCDLYTWEPEEFAVILAELYPKYPDIWLTTEHPLQGEIDTVNPKHMGYVQEPLRGIKNGAHSSRMVALGRYIDEHSGQLDPETWKQACAEAGVRPDAPWLIDPKLREGYLASMGVAES